MWGLTNAQREFWSQMRFRRNNPAHQYTCRLQYDLTILTVLQAIEYYLNIQNTFRFNFADKRLFVKMQFDYCIVKMVRYRKRPSRMRSG